MGAESPQNAGRPRPLPLRHPRLGLAPTSWRNLAIRGPCRPDSEREASWRLSSRVAPLQDPSCQPLREPRAPDPEAFWSCLYSTLPGVSEAQDPGRPQFTLLGPLGLSVLGTAQFVCSEAHVAARLLTRFFWP